MLAKTTETDESIDWKLMRPELDEIQFREWSLLLKSRAGIDIDRMRKPFLVSKLRMRMRELGVSDFQDYFAYLSGGRNGIVELAKLVDRLTIHETRFKRHPASFRLISEHFLPRYLADAPELKTVQAWSLGCATGEEAYTLALTLASYIAGEQLDLYYSVTATDISRESLTVGRHGCYHPSRLANLEREEVEHYFDKLDTCYQVVEALRRRVCFAQQSVHELSEAPFKKMDIIFCQNLLIYFEPDERQRIVQELATFLNPGGLLVLGVGEIFSWNHASLQRVEFEDTLAYRKLKD